MCRHCAALAPVLAALTKEEVMALLPSLVQAPTSLRLVYRRLATNAGALGGGVGGRVHRGAWAEGGANCKELWGRTI